MCHIVSTVNRLIAVLFSLKLKSNCEKIAFSHRRIFLFLFPTVFGIDVNRNHVQNTRLEKVRTRFLKRGTWHVESRVHETPSATFNPKCLVPRHVHSQQLFQFTRDHTIARFLLRFEHNKYMSISHSERILRKDSDLYFLYIDIPYQFYKF